MGGIVRVECARLECAARERALGLQPADDPIAEPSAARDDTRATIDKYCVTCHNQRLKTGDLALDAPELANVPAHADVWEKVIRQVRAGMMPPAGLPRPDEAARRALVASLESTLDPAARANPNPGRPLAHRLNRAEYANAVRDLLALDVDVTSMLPPDDSSGGFDNNADVLGVSPVLLESYLSAAERISALAIGDPKTPPIGELFRVRQDESQDRHIEGLPLGTMGGIQLQGHAAARRRVSVPGQAVPHQSRDDARARVSASARDQRGRGARASRRRSAATRRLPRRATTRRRPAIRWTAASRRACRSRLVRERSPSRSSRRRTR